MNIFRSKKYNNNNDVKSNALYEGSKDNFNKYLGGYCRNLVQKITRTYKNEIGCCEHCGERQKQLDAAHVQGKERKEIVESIISKYELNGRISINLEVFEKEFIRAHQPINEVIKILCKKCHLEYDNKYNGILYVDPVITTNDEVPSYKATRLLFKRKFIEQLDWNDEFIIHVTTSNDKFKLTKKEFYNVFNNVVLSNSYKIDGVYSYSTTPSKAYQFLVKETNSKNNRIQNSDLKVEPTTSTMKIGQHVQVTMRRLWQENKISDSTLLQLQSLDYAKTHFNAGFEILRKNSRSKEDNKGYNRYYKKEIIEGYWLSSQWYEHQRTLFDKWVRNLNK